MAPLASKYPELTPFQFASNTPIAAIDLDGLEGGLYSTNPLEPIYNQFANGIIGMGQWVDQTFSWGVEQTTTTEVKKKLEVNGKTYLPAVTFTEGTEVKTVVEHNLNFGNFLWAAKLAKGPIPGANLPPLIETKKSDKIYALSQVTTETQDSKAQVKTVSKPGEIKVEGSLTVPVKVRKAKAELKVATIQDTNTNKELKVELSGETSSGKVLVTASASGNTAQQSGAAKASVGYETTQGGTKFKNEAFFKVHTNKKQK